MPNNNHNSTRDATDLVVSGQRMGIRHDVKEIKGKVRSEKCIFCALLPWMMLLYRYNNASLFTADMPMHYISYDKCVDLLELLCVS